jgi:soluble cytochrome b562
LAVLLFKEGDIENAHQFLRIAMDDARKCNARLRILEINDIFSLVNSAFVQEIQLQKKQQRGLIIVISVLVLFLLVAIRRIRKQMRKTSKAHQETKNANNQLKQLNAELVNFNRRLTEANHEIAENSKIKEEYIAQFMDQCSLYIEKIDAYRKSLNKLLSAGKIDELKKALKSTDLMDEELKSFYRNFDATFLKLFPTFVADFNKLLTPDGQIVLKKEGQLNTELRVFALIRLGITDSVKIAQFLRYSVTTIYNYRNKAAGNRNELEDQIREIGRQSV